MSCFILRYRGSGAAPRADVERIRAAAEVRVLDESSPRMLLVEAPGQVFAELAKGLKDWVFSEERTVPMPNPRVKIRKHVAE